MLITVLVLGALLCVGLLSWAGLLNRLACWLYTTDLNRRISPRWYEKNREKIERAKARGRVSLSDIL